MTAYGSTMLLNLQNGFRDWPRQGNGWTLSATCAGLDARAANIVMRVVRNVADTGRTIVCTIHQPAIDIFEVLCPAGVSLRICLGLIAVASKVMVRTMSHTASNLYWLCKPDDVLPLQCWNTPSACRLIYVRACSRPALRGSLQAAWVVIVLLCTCAGF